MSDILYELYAKAVTTSINLSMCHAGVLVCIMAGSEAVQLMHCFLLLWLGQKCLEHSLQDAVGSLMSSN